MHLDLLHLLKELNPQLTYLLNYYLGAFKVFKTHISVNYLGLPLKAVLTTGNKYDSPFLPELLVSCELILADAGYDSETNRKACRKIKAKPIIAKER